MGCLFRSHFPDVGPAPHPCGGRRECRRASSSGGWTCHFSSASSVLQSADDGARACHFSNASSVLQSADDGASACQEGSAKEEGNAEEEAGSIKERAEFPISKSYTPKESARGARVDRWSPRSGHRGLC